MKGIIYAHASSILYPSRTHTHTQDTLSNAHLEPEFSRTPTGQADKQPRVTHNHHRTHRIGNGTKPETSPSQSQGSSSSQRPPASTIARSRASPRGGHRPAGRAPPGGHAPTRTSRRASPPGGRQRARGKPSAPNAPLSQSHARLRLPTTRAIQHAHTKAVGVLAVGFGSRVHVQCSHRDHGLTNCFSLHSRTKNLRSCISASRRFAAVAKPR